MVTEMKASMIDEQFENLMKGPYAESCKGGREGKSSRLKRILSAFESDGHPHGWKTFTQILDQVQDMNKRTLIRYLNKYPDTRKFFERKKSEKDKRNVMYRISPEYTYPSDFMIPSSLLEKAYSQQLVLLPQSGDGGDCFFVNLFNFPYFMDLDADAWVTLQKHLDELQRAYENLERALYPYVENYTLDRVHRFIWHRIKSDRGPVPPKETMIKMVEGLQKYDYQKPTILLSRLCTRRLDFIVRYSMTAALKVHAMKMCQKGWKPKNPEEVGTHFRENLKMDVDADNYLMGIYLEDFENLHNREKKDLTQRRAESERLYQVLQSRPETLIDEIPKGALAKKFELAKLENKTEFERHGPGFVRAFVEEWHFNDKLRDGVKYLEEMCNKLKTTKDISQFLSLVDEGHTKASEWFPFGFRPFETEAYREFTETIGILWAEPDMSSSKNQLAKKEG